MAVLAPEKRKMQRARCEMQREASCKVREEGIVRYKVQGEGESMVGEVSVWWLRKKGEKVKRRKVNR